ncbi:Ff.00g017410.m01.CDS01 [Fusarium sp. VM40]|nr:Ff.00g017410.m01.CDS01 [Fusarium sp. VM40]
MPRMNLGLPYNNCSLQPCPVGFQSPNLLRCGGCSVVKYCGKAHQKTDRPRHKVQCIPIADQNPFDTAVGLFWFFKSTRPYMQARFDYITAILNVRTGEAAEVALNGSLEMVHLCRGDNLGVRSQIPALYLRLERDQEAYDFIKWHGVKVTDDYDWRDMSLPYLDLKGEDAFEPVLEKPHYYDVSFTVALTLIKIRLLKDLESLQKFKRGKPNATGEEVYDYLQEEAMSDVLLNRGDIAAQDSYEGTIADLQGQILQLYKMVKEKNAHFWPGIMNPNLYAYDVPTIYTFGSRGEAVLIFHNSWYSWSETEPAIHYIREIISKNP